MFFWNQWKRQAFLSSGCSRARVHIRPFGDSEVLLLCEIPGRRQMDMGDVPKGPRHEGIQVKVALCAF